MTPDKFAIANFVDLDQQKYTYIDQMRGMVTYPNTFFVTNKLEINAMAELIRGITTLISLSSCCYDGKKHIRTLEGGDDLWRDSLFRLCKNVGRGPSETLV